MVAWAAVTECHTGRLIHRRNLRVIVLKPGCPGTCANVLGLLTADLSLCPYGAEGLCGVLFVRTLIPP